MARKYAGYKRVSVKVWPALSGVVNLYTVTVLSGNGGFLMEGNHIGRGNANNIARRLGDSFRPACTVRTTLAE